MEADSIDKVESTPMRPEEPRHNVPIAPLSATERVDAVAESKSTAEAAEDEDCCSTTLHSTE